MSDESGLGSIGSGIGSLIGAGLASDTIGQGISTAAGMVGAGVAELQPYNNAGVAVTPNVLDNLTGDTVGSANIGDARVNADTNPVDFENFAKDFTMSEGAKYDLGVASSSQDATAAARGGLLSGANQRAQTTIAEGIANKDLLQQYQAMLTGQQQDFAQRETAYQNLFGEQGLGEKAGASQALTLAEGARAIGSMYGQQANAQQGKGNGIGGLIGGALNFATK